MGNADLSDAWCDNMRVNKNEQNHIIMHIKSKSMAR